MKRKRNIPVAIVLEGPRGVGKTTVAKHLLDILYKNDYQGRVWKAERGEDPLGDMLNTIHEWSDPSLPYNFVHIVDRFHLTELVLRHCDGQSKEPSMLMQDAITVAASLATRVWTAAFILLASEKERTRRVIARADERKDISVKAARAWQSFSPDGIYNYNGLVSDIRLGVVMDTTKFSAFSTAYSIFASALTLYETRERMVEDGEL